MRSRRGRGVDSFRITIEELHASGVQSDGIIGRQRKRGVENAVVVALGPRDGCCGDEEQEEQDRDGAFAGTGPGTKSRRVGPDVAGMAVTVQDRL